MDVVVTTLNLAAIWPVDGISITWAGLGFLNLAQGTTFAFAGYGAWWASQRIDDSAVRHPGRRRHRALCGVFICLAVFLPLYGRAGRFAPDARWR
jgi:branched-chain amino acid transport system permease protein